jgi:hypothetical protein
MVLVGPTDIPSCFFGKAKSNVSSDAEAAHNSSNLLQQRNFNWRFKWWLDV